MIIRTLLARTLLPMAAIACLAAPALASPGALRLATDPTTVTPVAIDAKKAKDDEKSRVVCKRLNPAGSRTPGKKVCRTAGEWAAEEASAKEGLDDLTRRSLTSAPRM
jgi:hypothetical protein